MTALLEYILIIGTTEYYGSLAFDAPVYFLFVPEPLLWHGYYNLVIKHGSIVGINIEKQYVPLLCLQNTLNNIFHPGNWLKYIGNTVMTLYLCYTSWKS